MRRMINRMMKVKRESKVQFSPEVNEQEQNIAKEDSVTQHNQLIVICGDPKASGKHIALKVQSVAALNQFEQISATFALKLLSVCFSDEETSVSNATYTAGRRLLDQNTLLGI